MHKRLKAAVAPAVIVAAIMSWAGFARALDTGSPARRLDELGEKRPVAASHLPADGALVAAANKAAEEQLWIEGAQARQMELFLQAAADAEAEQSQPTAPARTGRGGGGVGGACGGATNGADAYIARESGGNPNARNSSGAWGCYQIMPGTWSGSCSDLGQYGSASTGAQAACASRLPRSAWGG